MDDATSTIVTDFSGRGNNGTMSGFANPATASSGWGDGKMGKALSFDGSNDYINLAQNRLNTQLQGAPGITFSVWIKYDTLPDLSQDGNVIFTHGINVGSNGSYLNLRADAGSEGMVQIITRSGAGDALQRKSSALKLVSGQWYHVVGVGDFPNDLSYIYINGVLSGGAQSTTYANNSYVGGTASVGNDKIGADLNGIEPFDGKIDDLRIYGRALSATEVAALYGSRSAKFTTPSSTGLVGYWSMDDATSTIASDFSGKGNNGILQSGTSWSSGKRGAATSFNGTTGFIDLSAPASLNLASVNRFTLSAWVYPTSAPNDLSVITEMFLPTNLTVQYGIGFDMDGITNASRLAVGFFDGTWRIVRDSVNVAVNAWTHIAGTWDGTTLSLYKNGVLVNSGAPGGSLPATNFDKVVIGKRHDLAGAIDFFPGKIDEARIYNRALSAAEIAGLYRSGQVITNASQNTKLTNGLVGLWSFNGQDITWGSNFMRDGSGNGNNGTLGSFSRTSSIDFGVSGQALKFDGSANQVTSATQFVNPQTFSISIWFKTTVASGRKLIGFETGQTGTASISYDRHLSMGTDGKIYFGWYPGSITTVASLSTLNDGQWHHAVGTHNGSNGILYIDGVYQGTNTGSPQSYNGYWRIGGYKLATWTNSSDGYFSGSLDEARVYNRTITPQEVKQLYNMGRSQ